MSSKHNFVHLLTNNTEISTQYFFNYHQLSQFVTIHTFSLCNQSKTFVTLKTCKMNKNNNQTCKIRHSLQLCTINNKTILYQTYSRSNTMSWPCSSRCNFYKHTSLNNRSHHLPRVILPTPIHISKVWEHLTNQL